MKKLSALLAIMLLTAMLCACENREPIEDLVITGEEEALLILTFQMDEEDVARIKEGDFYSNEEDCIINTRATLEYLEKKYPGVEFTVTLYEPPYHFVGGHDYPIVTYTDDSGSNKEYIINLIQSEEGEIIFEDNYYGTLVRAAYDQYLMNLLAENNFGKVVTYTDIRGNFGTEVNGKITVEEILEKDISKHSKVFIEGNSENAKLLAKDVEKLIREEDIYGSYMVYVLEDIDGISDDGQELFEYIKENGSELEARSFNTWSEMEE